MDDASHRVDPQVQADVVKALVVLTSGYSESDALRRQLLAHARNRLSAVVTPKHSAFRYNLPLTRCGRFMRRLLKARKLALPEGDISTLPSDDLVDCWTSTMLRGAILW